MQIVLMDKQEMRMRFIQLMNDDQKTLGRKETINIIKDLAFLGKAFCLVLLIGQMMIKRLANVYQVDLGIFYFSHA